jgi:hypothetical protein
MEATISYELLIENRVSGQIGSNNGFFQMARYCEKFGGECYKFFNSGRSDDPKTLRHELLLILHGRSKPPSDIADRSKCWSSGSQTWTAKS